MKKSLPIRGVLPVLAMLFLPGVSRPAAGQGYFDWRNIDGKDYTTPIRSQSLDGEHFAGTCWAFAAVAAVEARLEICYDEPDWNPDLSEQHLVCDGTAGSATSGWEYRALQFIEDTGIVSEAELPYTAENSSPDWPLEDGWEDRVYTITGYEKLLDTSTDNVKSMLRTYGPLVASVYTPDDWIPRPDSAPPTSAGAGDDPTGGTNHSLCVVGYMDDELIDGGGYWITKNSWGAEYGDNGYYYIPYGTLESRNRIYAVTGDALAPVPEPASMLLLSAGFVLLWKRQNS